jgi:hypothetical protein
MDRHQYRVYYRRVSEEHIYYLDLTCACPTEAFHIANIELEAKRANGDDNFCILNITNKTEYKHPVIFGSLLSH